jgi:hypothetical protein
MTNVRFDTAADGRDRTNRPGNWQVIFKIIKDGNELDYCP